MPLTGAQPALMVARVGLLRLGASRVGYLLPSIFLTINGVSRATGGQVLIEQMEVQDFLDGEPNIATMRVRNFTPVHGQEVRFGLGGLGTSTLIFAGHIRTVKQIYLVDKPANLAFDLTCVSYEWLLNRRKVTTRYQSASASGIARDLIGSFTSGFTAAHVEDGLATLDEFTLTNEDVTDALDRLAKRVGAYWYIDYAKDLWFFTASPAAVHTITDGNVHTARDIKKETDLTPVRTRVLVEGRGSASLVRRVPGDTTLPIADQSWASASGGTFVSGPQRVTYTGVSAVAGTGTTVAGRPLAPSTPSAAVVSETSGNLSAGDYRHRVTFDGENGESEVSNNSGPVTITSIAEPTALTATVSATLSGNLSKGSRRYRLTMVTSAGETQGGTVTGLITITEVEAPLGTPLGTGTTGGDMALDSYTYYITYVTADGETSGFGVPFDVALSGGDDAVDITGIPTSSDGRVTARRIYRGSSSRAPSLVTTIANNTSTTYTDTKEDEDLGAPMPSSNTTGWGRVSLTSIPTSADDRVIRRRIYRTTAGGTAYKLLTTINDNATTTFTDNVSDAALGADEPTVNTSGSGQIALTSIPLGPAGTLRRRLYRTEADGTVYKLLATIGNNTDTTYTDNIRDSSLGAEAPTVSQVGAAAGDTTLRVADTSVVPASGGWATIGSQVIQFTGRSTASGEGNLTGIPASGEGSLAAGVRFGAEVINAPFLTGIPAAGAGAIQYPIAAGDELNLFVTRNDTAAQTVMAGLVGGDGIIEDYIQDRRLSQGEAEDRGDAKLNEVSDPVVTMTYQTRDRTTRSGRSVTFALGAPTNISGTFKIQQVTFTDFDPRGRRWPLCTVTASSRIERFEALLRMIRKQVA